LILYEYPFNEGIRTMLRMEHLFDRLGQLIARDTSLDHHYAMATIFEIVDVASRADLKADLLKELDRQRHTMQGWRGNPTVEAARLDTVIGRIDTVYDRLNALPGKAGADLVNHEWLMTIRSRIGIPGGTCEFDLPSYHAWQKREPSQRRSDLLHWITTLKPFAEAQSVLLGLLRESGAPSKVMVTSGQYQQSLPSGKVFHLMRVRFDAPAGVVPELSGHRLMASIRLMQMDDQWRLKPAAIDLPIELTLCA
jgi:cell division protein ZapD